MNSGFYIVLYIALLACPGDVDEFSISYGLTDVLLTQSHPLVWEAVTLAQGEVTPVGHYRRQGNMILFTSDEGEQKINMATHLVVKVPLSDKPTTIPGANGSPSVQLQWLNDDVIVRASMPELQRGARIRYFRDEAVPTETVPDVTESTTGHESSTKLSVLPDTAKQPLRSIILLLKTPRSMKTTEVADWFAGLSAPLASKKDAFTLVPLIEGRQFMIRWQDMVALLSHDASLCFENPTSVAALLPDVEAGRAVRAHRAWLSLDLLHGPGDRDEQYAQLARLGERLMDKDVLALFLPETGKVTASKERWTDTWTTLMED